MIIHIVKRGGRGMPIVHDESDRYDYLKCLYFLNDANHPSPWRRDVAALGEGLRLERPGHWPKERKPYVDILSYHLHDNHHHLLLRELQGNGISAFMKSLGASMTQSYNEKQGTKGSIFQGRPSKKFVENDNYLRKLYVYINVKNPFELYEGGVRAAIDNFNDAWEQSLEYSFSSFPDIVGERDSPIVDTQTARRLFASPQEFKKFAREQMGRYQQFLNEVNADDLE